LKSAPAFLVGGVINVTFCQIYRPAYSSQISPLAGPGADIDNFRICNKPFKVYFTKTGYTVDVIGKIPYNRTCVWLNVFYFRDPDTCSISAEMGEII
jgi:hypothetical protein